MGWEHGEPKPGEDFFRVIHAGLQENWDWPEVGEGGLQTLLQRQYAIQLLSLGVAEMAVTVVAQTGLLSPLRKCRVVRPGA